MKFAIVDGLKIIPCYGWGVFIDKNKFINNFK